MKFARYLDEASAPEWKRAYLDYKGLKKRITAVRREQGSRARLSSDEDAAGNELPPSASEAKPLDLSPELKSHPQSGNSRDGSGADEQIAGSPLRVSDPLASPSPHGEQSKTSLPPGASAHASGRPYHSRSSRPSLRRRSGSQFFKYWPGPSASNEKGARTIEELLVDMTPAQLAFFSALDREREKVEAFYIAREREAVTLTADLRKQLAILKEHRALYHKIHPGSGKSWALVLMSERRAEAVRRKFFEFTGYTLPRLTGFRRGSRAPGVRSKDISQAESQAAQAVPSGTGSRTPRTISTEAARFDPDEYEHARKRLKKALKEQYRVVEILNNYRVLNLTGFRKALKKFEKITRIQAQEFYLKEKIEPCAFAHGDILQHLLGDMEDLFSARFTHGSRKRALNRLRGMSSAKTHHSSTFRTGLLLGLSLPALASGIVLSFSQAARVEIPGWDALLFVYGTFLVPTLLSLLVGLNLLVWSQTRINYVFIFDLDPRYPMDYREYSQIPALTLATLSYAFWLSFSRSGGDAVSPQTWPLIWLLLVLAFLINPLPLASRSSRAWLFSNLFRQVTSGVRRVEFADFWLGDQLTSLAFFLGNIYFIACAYHAGFNHDPTRVCSTPRLWGIPFLLATTPLVVRLVQSIRRWFDSRLYTHLINGGKYGAGVLYYLFYYFWRHNGGARDESFVLFCLFGAVYSIYACSWDLLMDWSVLQLHARHLLLRDNILYNSYIPVYYFSIISNLLLRFSWVIYIPHNGPPNLLRTWIVAMLEILRRWQWNFYRLENEHVGNMDQYRITREVPMYYSRDDIPDDADDTDEGDGIERRRGG